MESGGDPEPRRLVSQRDWHGIHNPSGRVLFSPSWQLFRLERPKEHRFFFGGGGVQIFSFDAHPWPFLSDSQMSTSSVGTLVPGTGYKISPRVVHQWAIGRSWANCATSCLCFDTVEIEDPLVLFRKTKPKGNSPSFRVPDFLSNTQMMPASNSTAS